MQIKTDPKDDESDAVEAEQVTITNYNVANEGALLAITGFGLFVFIGLVDLHPTVAIIGLLFAFVSLFEALFIIPRNW